MSDRYIPGVPCWVDTVQADPEAAVAFYGDLFGWELENVMPPDAPGKYYTARLDGGDVGAISSQPEGVSDVVWNTYVWVENADETAAKVRSAGGRVLSEPMDVGDAGRMAVFADPAGAAFSVWQPARHRGATVVNEHGAVNFNDLKTPDLDGARAFYGAVFGWDLIDVGGTMYAWALPAYGDFLEERTPGMRENMATMGAPTRFEEVVASLSPTDGDARWDVTFGANDVKVVAERAAELGGTVVVPPFDAPWSRMAVITDPQGATFTASQFVPENKEVARQEPTRASA
jgi:predicted enzyme related to lactoylglutathione lyase